MHKKQRKFEGFNKVNCKNDTKPFWNKCKTFFPNKYKRGDINIMLKEKGGILLQMM